MLSAAWTHVRGDIASTPQGAAAFLGKVERTSAAARQDCGAERANVGDAQCHLSNLSRKKGTFAEATEAWLCALTAFEVAKRLVDNNGPQSEELSVKVEECIQKVGHSLEQVERVEIPCGDETEFFAYYLPAGGPDSCAPAVICISGEEEAPAALLGRLLPSVIGRQISVLVVSHDDLSNRWGSHSETLLSCCLDYLSVRPGVDATRVGVYGEGLSAALATDFAVSDRRVAAAVCDGGLWNWARTLASVGWMTGATDVPDEDEMSARRSRLVRQLKCPVLVVAGECGTVSVSEAIKLQTDCAAARMSLDLAMPQMTLTSGGELENFVASDDYIFGWLEHKLATIDLHNPGRPGP